MSIVSMRRSPFSISLVVLILLVACQPTLTPGPTRVDPTHPVATLVPTLAPSPTPPPPLALLVDDGQGDPLQAGPVLSTLQELSAASGFQLETRPALSASDLSPKVSLVVALPPDPGLEALARGASSTQFVGINLPGLKPGENLSLIGDGQADLYQAFLGGYLATLTAEDWGAGVVMQPGDLAGQAALNGGAYLCGLCTPKYPPYENYPVPFEIASPADWPSVVDAAPGRGVRTLYVTPQLSTPESLAGLAKAGFKLVSTVTPPDSARSTWVATIGVDLSASLETLWPDLVAGKGGLRLPIRLEITQVDSGLLTPGRLQQAQLVAQDLAGGLILPTNPPQ